MKDAKGRVRRGELWWGPTVPGLHTKRRPFLIVSRDTFNRDERYLKALVVHLTSVRRPDGPYDWEVEVPRGAGGIPSASVAKCNEVYTVFKQDLKKQIGSLPAILMGRVDSALALVLALPAPTAAND